jgi:hypothetical protein
VYDGTKEDDPRSHTYSQSAAVQSFYGSSYFGTVTSPGVTTMQAAPRRLRQHCPASSPPPPPPTPPGCLQSHSRTAVTRGTATTGAACTLPSRRRPPHSSRCRYIAIAIVLLACCCRDKQDWKREGAFYYALYNGANYYRCNGTWGVSISRSSSAVGPEYAPALLHHAPPATFILIAPVRYTERLPLSQGIAAERHDTCGISYPMLNVVDGQPFVYYAFVHSSGLNQPLRSAIVPK